MQINHTVGIMYAQTGFASRAASEATTAPEVALAMSRTMASEMAKLEQNQVQATEAAIESRITDNGEHEGGSRGSFDMQDDNAKEREPEQANAPNDPFVGNLLNIKV